MFIRLKKHPYSDNITVLVCCSKRENKQVKQIVLCKIGTSNMPAQLTNMQAIAKQLILLLQKQTIMDPTDSLLTETIPTIDQVREINRQNTGIKDIVGTLYQRLGFNKILSNSKMNEILQAVVLARFTEPSSKLKASSILQRKFGLDHSVDSIYRMMDALSENIEQAKKAVFTSTVATMGSAVDLMFFDVTTLSFETLAEDELRNFGFSKDCKFNTTQVVLALATTQEGLPIGYKLFPGNTAEVKTLIACVKEWREQIGIREAIVVADRAMMSADNLRELVAANMGYVVACPLRKLPKEIKAKILSAHNYEFMVMQEQGYWKKELTLAPEQRLVVTYNKARHLKDQKTRERLLKRIEKRLGKRKQSKKLISNQGYLKYVTIAGESVATLNQQKVIADAAWDGLHGVITNTNLPAAELLARYKNLWVIEESFRINKHNLKMRPIYHYTPQRIGAHIMICFLTYALIRQLQYIVRQNNLALTVEAMREELLDVQASILADVTSGELYKIPSYMAAEIKELYRILGLSYELKPRKYFEAEQQQ
jgi:transposase